MQFKILIKALKLLRKKKEWGTFFHLFWLAFFCFKFFFSLAFNRFTTQPLDSNAAEDSLHQAGPQGLKMTSYRHTSLAANSRTLTSFFCFWWRFRYLNTRLCCSTCIWSAKTCSPDIHFAGSPSIALWSHAEL